MNIDKKQVKHLFDLHPKQDTIHATEDGNLFFSPSDAQNYTIDKKFKEHPVKINRSSFEFEKGDDAAKPESKKSAAKEKSPVEHSADAPAEPIIDPPAGDPPTTAVVEPPAALATAKPKAKSKGKVKKK